MKYYEFLDILKCDKVLVVGCQRSGTRFVAHAIAKDMGYKYLDEQTINFSSAHNARLRLRENRVVLQAPAVSSEVAAITAPDVAIVWINRDRDDVIKSQQRIGWFNTGSEQHEWNKLWSIFEFGQDGALPMGKRNLCKEHGRLFDINCKKCEYEQLSIYDMKKVFWRETHVHNQFEVEYESLKSHPLWVSPEDRDPNNIVKLQIKNIL